MPAASVVLLFTVTTGLAQTATTPAVSPKSLTDQVMEKARRMHEYLNLMNDKDQAVRLAAVQSALKDPDPVARGMAISAYLKRFDALTPEVVLDSASSVAQSDVPRLAVFNVRWSDDAGSFVGSYSTTCGGNPPAVRGQVAGGKLAINFDAVCIRASLLSNDTVTQRKGDEVKLVGCQLTLAPNEQGDMLQGPLHCVGMSDVLNVQLPFGA